MTMKMKMISVVVLSMVAMVGLGSQAQEVKSVRKGELVAPIQSAKVTNKAMVELGAKLVF